MTKLRLDALDADDLSILSACCQDALTRVEDCLYLPSEQRFVVGMNRFVWESAIKRSRLAFWRRPDYERRRAALQFERVEAVRRTGFSQSLGGQVLALLAIRFVARQSPGGSIELVFAGGSAIRLDVECIEARLTDLDAGWSTSMRPDHETPQD